MLGHTKTLKVLLLTAVCAAILSSVPAVSFAAPTTTSTTTTVARATAAAVPTPTSNFIFPTATTSSTTPTSTPSSGTTAPNTSNNSTGALYCPPPLIYNVHGITSDSCHGDCCAPCPGSAVFYEPNKLEDVYTLTSVLRAVSAIAVGFLSICYLILPNRRKHPHSIVLWLSLAGVPWEGIGTVWLYKKKDLLCHNEYEIATMTNSWLCGFQGISLMYLVLAMLCLAVLMITNLHFLAVHRSGFVQTHMTKFIVLSFILPLSLVLPVAIRQQIENPGFGSICFVSAQVASPYFFYPLAVIVTLATLLHLGTIIFMIRSTIRARSASVSDSVPSDSEFSSSDGSGKGPSKKIRGLQTARDISLFFKQQWRPGLFALWTLIVQMIYWLFYFLEAKKLETIQSNPPWFSQWVLCLVQQAGISAQSGLLSLTSPTPDQLQIAGDAAQRACASIAESNVPSFMWAAFADMLPATIGITNLIIFGTKLELWQDLRNLLCGAPRKTTEYSMDRVSKESQDRHHRHHSQSDDQDHDQTQEKRGHGIQGKQSKQHSRQDGSDFKNKDHRTDDGEFHTSRDILIAPPQSMAQNGSIGMALQSESRVDTHSAAGIGAGASGSSPTASGSLKGSNGRPSFGGPTRKLSVRFQDREPILYRQPSTTESAPSPPSPSPPSPRQPTQSPSRHFPHSGPLDIQSLQSHQDSLHEKINLHHARLVTEGTDPWPSWPSSVPTIDTPSSAPLIVEARRPSLTVRTNSMGSQQHRQNPSISSSNPRATPVSPRTPDLSSSRAGFYNSEDLAAGEALQAARRGSNNSTSTTQGHPPTPTRVGSVRDTGRGPSYEYDRREQSPIYGDASLPSPVHALSPPPVPQRSQSRRRS